METAREVKTSFKCWGACSQFSSDRYGVPSRILFLNKMDRPGASFRASMQSILNYKLHPRPLAITLPVASFDPSAYTSAEPGIEGVVDLVKWELWKWEGPSESNDVGMNFTVHKLPTSSKDLEKSALFADGHPLARELVPARRAMLDNLSMHSEQLMDVLLDLPDPSAYASVASEHIIPALRSAVLMKEVLPILCGSAMKHIGTDLVLNYTGLLLASPLDVPGAKALQSSHEVQMLAWKVAWDKRRGWMTFVRIYSGESVAQSKQLVL
jgi:elongation factor G